MKANKLFIFILCSFFFCHLQAQWFDPQKVNKKAANIYNMAIDNAVNLKYPQAVKMLNDAIVIEPGYLDAYLSLAAVYANMKNYNASVLEYEIAFKKDSIYSADYLLPYSISLAGEGKFEKALNAVNQFLLIKNLNPTSIKAGQFRKKTYEFALDYAAKHTSDYIFNPINLGDSINTANLEYFPSLTIDGKKLIFNRRINSSEQFYESDLGQNNKWMGAKPLEGKIATPGYNEGAQNISQDGQWLVFTGCNFPGGMGSCDLYISYMTRQGWSQPENLGPNINSEFWESSPSLSPDKQDLYFSSNVSGGFGGEDLWVSHRSKDGTWGPAKNLGAAINTSGDESCPYMHADNQTLYFNSTGLPGYSEKADLFVTHKLPDGGWSKPENLGYPVNTIDDEGSLIVSSDGKTAYYASDRKDTKGGLDIYSFELRKDLRPLKTLWVKGKVFDAKTKNGLPSSVELTNVNNRQLISKVQTDENGNYLTTLPTGNNYAFNVTRKGYLFFSENFDLTGKESDSPYVLNIPLEPIAVNAAITLKNVFFDTKQTTLKPASITELDNLVRLMSENPKLKIRIEGHTDNIGKPVDNMALSTGRALAVVKYIENKGIMPSRLTFKGLGDTKPIKTNDTEKGRASNRRTDIIITDN